MSPRKKMAVNAPADPGDVEKPAEKKVKLSPLSKTEIKVLDCGPKQTSLFGPQDDIINALEMEVSSSIVEIERLEEQIEKRRTKIDSLKTNRLEVLKGALAAAKKLRKDREKQLNSDSEKDKSALPF